MLLCWQAYAQLHMGNPQTAEKICRHVDEVLRKNAADLYSVRHLETLQKIIMANVYYNGHEYNKAIRAAETAMETAQKQDLKLLGLMNYSLLSKIYRQLEMEKQLFQTQQQIELIQKSTSFKQVARMW
jgi:tetratricopeptide (TPR) repeat protein